jgi:hypothetical protein
VERLKETAACLHPHPALRATFPRLGEGFPHRKSLRFNRKLCRYAKGSPFGRAGALAPERASTQKNKSICNENAVFLKFRKRWLQMLFCFV